MYNTLYRDIRLTDKFFDSKMVEKLKQEIINGKYFVYWKDISGLNTMAELFELFGLKITDIQDDEYHWATFDANVLDIKNIEQLLKNYKSCFYEFSKLTFRQPGSYNYLLFSQKSGKFIEETLDYIVQYVDNQRFDIYHIGEEFYQKRHNGNEHEKVSVCDVYSDFTNAWSEDSNFYVLRKEAGLWKCRYDVIIYDGISIEMWGYGHNKYEALQMCEESLEKLKEMAINNGYKEDDD